MICLALTRDVLRVPIERYARIVFLDDDYGLLLRLRSAVPEGTTVETLGGAFDAHYEQVKEALLQCLVELGRRRRPERWWSGQVASRSSTASNLVRNVIYARFGRDVLARGSGENVLLACADAGLLECLRRVCRGTGAAFRCEVPWTRRLGDGLGWLGRTAANVAFIARDLLSGPKLRRLLPPADLAAPQSRVLVRSWVTADTVGDDGRFRDRNFGELPEFLRRRGAQVVFVPMFFNLGRSLDEQLAAMARSGEAFLLPQHVVGPLAGLPLVWIEVRRWFERFRGVRVDGIDISPILNYENRRAALDPSMFRLNLVYPLLRKLESRGVRIDGFLYPFENNAPEKMFILGARAFYPGSEIVGFQHSVWLSRQAGAELLPGEAAAHPLADRIVCSGRVYVGVLEELNFPRSRLVAGPSLRFGHIRGYPVRGRTAGRGARPAEVFVALPYNRDNSFEVLAKLRAAIGRDPGYRVRVKAHPLLDRGELADFIGSLGFSSLELVGGECRDGFLKSDVAIGIGTSVAQMEAVACGVPLIRVVPDNTFFLDPMKWLDYPLPAVSTPEQLRESLPRALALDADRLAALAATVKRDYFAEVTEESMAVFERAAAASGTGSARVASATGGV